MSEQKGGDTAGTIAKVVIVLFVVAMFFKFCTGNREPISDAELRDSEAVQEGYR